MLQEKFSHHGVNWFDGMSINKSHFIAQENHMMELYIDAVGRNLNPNNYGLLPSYNGEQYSFQSEIDNRKIVNVKIRNLRAVTLSGARIEITGATLPTLELTKNLSELKPDKNKDKTIALVIGVNSFSRVPFGDPDPEETPPRKPYVLPEYTLGLVPYEELGGAEIGPSHITLGLFHYRNGQFSVDSEFIPPCTSLNSLPVLLSFLESTEASLIQLEGYVTRIVQKVRGKQQENKLAQSIGGISQNLLTYLSHHLPSVSLHLQHQAPVYLIEKIVALSKITYNSIETWQGTGKEELLNYLTEWCDLNQGMLDKTLSELAVLKYQHHNTANAVQKANDFLRIIIPLFKTLSDLDYIGKKVDTNLFVTEEVAETEPEEKRPLLKNWFRK